MSEAPPFWFEKPGLAAWSLSPFGWIYGRIVARRMKLPARNIPDLPVICVGNFIAGGAGKTPTVIALSKLAAAKGVRCGVLSRGYGAQVHQPTLVDPAVHNARDVGDEPLLLAQEMPTVVSPDRPAGAELLAKQKIDLILMDDGLQNPSLHKDYSLAVIDSGRGIGNGFCMPAGPLRANLPAQLSVASAILLIGELQGANDVVRRTAKMAKPILQASIKLNNAVSWNGRKVLAYAGIADPSKFHASLEQAGAEVVVKRNFHDHHPFSDDECTDLMAQAKDQKLLLATTSKDYARLSRMGKAQQALQEQSEPLAIQLIFENPVMVSQLIEKTISDARQFRQK